MQSVVLKNGEEFDALGQRPSSFEPEPLDTSPFRLEPAPEPAAPPPQPEPTVVRSPTYTGPDRRKADRRGVDALRAEALRNVMSQVEDRNFGGLRERAPWRGGMKLSRFALLAVAIVAGGLAAWIATQREAPMAPAVAAQPETIVVAEPTVQVLVAREPVAVGQRLGSAAFDWVAWPESATHPEFILQSSAPDAVESMAGFAARSEILAGEPIRQEKLVPATGGYLSAVLEGGMRAVSVLVNAQSASGGFVAPNDRVDVVLTRETPAGMTTDTVVTDVRVLAINNRLGEGAATDEESQSETFSGEAITTLELDPIQAETIVAAGTMGQLSLVLRSMLDVGARADASLSANQAIRLTSPFWNK